MLFVLFIQLSHMLFLSPVISYVEDIFQVQQKVSSYACPCLHLFDSAYSDVIYIFFVDEQKTCTCTQLCRVSNARYS
jgi:hypothetical protein